LLLALLLPASAEAQFNGSFAMERHFLDAENFLDWRAYLPPPSWRWEVYRRPNRLGGSVGSISEERFYQALDIHLEKELGRYAAVLYRQREESLFRPDPPYQEIELRLGAGPWFVSALGFPRHEKVNGAQGAALAWGRRTDDVYIQYTVLEQYTLYNQEHSGPERFSPPPILHRIEARYAAPGVFLAEAALRREAPTRLNLPEDDLALTYWGRKVDASSVWFVSKDLALGAWGGVNAEQRAQVRTAATAAEPESRQRLEWSWWEIYGTWAAGEGDMTVAVNDALLINRIESGQAGHRFRHRLQTTQLYGLWQRPGGAGFRWMFTLQAGGVFLFQEPSTHASRGSDGYTVQIKAGAGFALIRENDYRLWFHTTWDGDAFTRRQWDGGNLQLQLFF
jgi:hypothetical protein